MLLCFDGPLMQLTETMEADGSCERIPGLALVEFRCRSSPELRLFQRVQSVKGALDTARLAQDPLSVTSLFAERDAQPRRERETDEQLQRRNEEELAEPRMLLRNFRLTDEIIKFGFDRIRRAFERGETEMMVAAFPSDLSIAGDHAVINADALPINKPTRAKPAPRGDEPEWPATPPAGFRRAFNYWKQNLRLGGSEITVHIINCPDGKPGDIGSFVTRPKSKPKVCWRRCRSVVFCRRA